MCTVKPYHIVSRKIWTFCRKASLPFPGGNGLWECGITFDIFTHVLHGSSFFEFCLEFINIFIKIHDEIKEIHNDALDEGYNVELK